MKIEVTADDIENGVHHVRTCPVSLAIRRKIPDVEVFTWHDSICIYDPRTQKARHFDTPWVVSNFVKGYDKNIETSPFEFELPDSGEGL